MDSESNTLELNSPRTVQRDFVLDTQHSVTFANFIAKRQLFLVIAFVAVAFLAGLAWPIFSGRVYVADDLGEFHLPLRAFYAEQLARGEAFDWCPSLYCGFYLTGEGQVGGYHPLHLLLYQTLPLWLAFDLECWVTYALMLVGVYLLLRRLRFPSPAALFGGITFTFGGFALLHFVHPNAVAIVAHLPWLLWAIDYLLRSPDARQRRFAFAGVALLTGSQLLLGYPQYVFFSLLVEAAYVIWLVRGNDNSGRNRFADIAKFTVAVLIGILIGGIQLIPTIEALQLSARSTPTADFAAQGSLNPLNTVQLVAPYLFQNRVVGANTHELALYLGAIPLVLAVWCLINRSDNPVYKRVEFAAAATALVALVWAFGTFGPFAWLQAHLPLVNSFRFPCRAIVVFQFAMMVLAAIGFTRLLNATKSRPMNLSETEVRLLWMLPIGSCFIVVVGSIFWREYISSFLLAAIGPIAFAAAVLLINRAATGSRLALTAIVLFCGIDLGIYGFSSASLRQTATLPEFISATCVPPGPANTRVSLDADTAEQEIGTPAGMRIGNRILLAGWKRADGYAGLEPARRLDYQAKATLRVAGAGWTIAQSFAANPQSNQLEPTLRWANVQQARPRAWLVTKTFRSKKPAKDIARINTSSAALVDYPIALPPGKPGTATVLRDLPGRILIETQADTDQLLVINESFHPGWVATSNSLKCTPIRANGDFMGIVVPPGTHQLTLEFQPASLRNGRLASGFGLGFIVAVLLWPLPRRHEVRRST